MNELGNFNRKFVKFEFLFHDNRKTIIYEMWCFAWNEICLGLMCVQNDLMSFHNIIYIEFMLN